MTWVYRLERRVCFSVKIKAELKNEFTETVKEKGFSTCFIIETLLTAWLEGLRAPAKFKVDSGQTIQITQNFSRTFVRERRGGLMKVPKRKDQWFDVDVLGEVSETNCFDPEIGWFYDKDQPLSDIGHSVLCKCSKCRR